MKWSTTLAALGFAICLTACHRNPPLTLQEQEIVTELTANLTPRCVGRYVIDMPGDALAFSFATLNGVKVEAKAMTQKGYETALDARSQELKTAKHYLGYPFLYADDKIEGIAGSRYFISLESTVVSTDAERVIEAYKWSRGYQIELKISVSDAKDSIAFKDDPVRNEPYMNDVPEKLHLVISMLERIRGRTEDEIPTEPGVCFVGGFLPGRATAQENISTQFVLKNKHDVGFDFDTDANIRETTTLLQRGADINAMLKQNEGRTIRKGRVDLSGMETEEWLTSGLTYAHIQGHYFALEANSREGSAKTPLVTLDMDNGGLPLKGEDPPQKASLTEGEAVALWDAVSRTLRPRPNAF